MRSPQKGRSRAPARWSMQARAFPTARGSSFPRSPWSRRARRSCKASSCRYPRAGAQRAFAGVDQVHDGQSFRQRTDRTCAFDGREMHRLVTLVAFALAIMDDAVDGKPPAEHISFDGFVREIDPYLPDPRLIQIVHVHLNRLRSAHLQQKIDVVIHLELSRAGRPAKGCHAAPRAEQP